MTSQLNNCGVLEQELEFIKSPEIMESSMIIESRKPNDERMSTESESKSILTVPKWDGKMSPLHKSAH